MTTTNPLVAGPVEMSTPLSGTFLLEDGEALAAAIKNGDWIAGGMAAFAGLADGLATVSDPLGSLVAAGLGWVMEHIEPLKGWMNDLTGDAGEVAGFAGTWANVSTQLGMSADDLAKILADVDEMDGAAIQAYQAFQLDVEKHLRAAGSWADAMSIGLEIASTIVKIVHDVVRDAISEVVGAIISYAAELVFSLGLATPLVIEQVSTRVASLVGRVGKAVTKVVEAGKQLGKLLDQLKRLFKEASDLFDRVLKGVDTPVKTNPKNAPLKNYSGPPWNLDRQANDLRKNIRDWAKNHPGYDPTGGLPWSEFLDKYLKGFDKNGYPDWRWPDKSTAPNGFGGPDFPASVRPGDVIDRITPGGADGKFASPAGSPTGDRALPPDRLSPAFATHNYEVVKPLPPEVRQGPIAPWFEQPGNGMQYYFPKGIEYYITHGYLKPV